MLVAFGIFAVFPPSCPSGPGAGGWGQVRRLSKPARRIRGSPIRVAPWGLGTSISVVAADSPGCLSVSGLVLIGGPLLGMRGQSATWGTGNDPKVREETSDGGAPNEVLDRDRRKAPWLHARPAQQ